MADRVDVRRQTQITVVLHSVRHRAGKIEPATLSSEMGLVRLAANAGLIPGQPAKDLHRRGNGGPEGHRSLANVSQAWPSSNLEMPENGASV